MAIVTDDNGIQIFVPPATGVGGNLLLDNDAALSAFITTHAAEIAANLSAIALNTTSRALLTAARGVKVYAHEFPGDDMGEKINNAFASLADTGGEAVVIGGRHEYATPILSPAGKDNIILSGQGGATQIYHNRDCATELIFTPTSGNAVTIGGVNEYERCGHFLRDIGITTNGKAVGVAIQDAIYGQMQNVRIRGDASWGLVNATASGTAPNGTPEEIAEEFSILLDDDETFTGVEVDDYVVIVRGTGLGQLRKISAVETGKLTISVDWDIKPDNTSEYIAAVAMGVKTPDVASGVYGWDCYNLTVMGYGIDFVANGIHALNLHSCHIVIADIGLLIQSGGQVSIFGGNIESNRVSGIDMIGGKGLLVSGTYFENGDRDSLTRSIRLGNGYNGNLVRGVNIHDCRFVGDVQGNSDDPLYMIEINNLRGLSIVGNYVRVTAAGAFILNNHINTTQRITIDANELPDISDSQGDGSQTGRPELIVGPGGTPDYTGVAFLHDVRNAGPTIANNTPTNLYMLPNLPAAAGLGSGDGQLDDLYPNMHSGAMWRDTNDEHRIKMIP